MAVYNKLSGKDMATSCAMVEETAKQMGESVRTMNGACTAWLPGYRIKTSGGNGNVRRYCQNRIPASVVIYLHDFRCRATGRIGWLVFSVQLLRSSELGLFSSILALNRAVASNPAGTATIPKPIMSMAKVNTFPPTVIGYTSP